MYLETNGHVLGNKESCTWKQGIMYLETRNHVLGNKEFSSTLAHGSQKRSNKTCDMFYMLYILYTPRLCFDELPLSGIGSCV